MSGAAKHDFHMVDPSRWPMVGAIAAFSLAFGLVLYMHPQMAGGIGEMFGILTIVPGIVLMAITMIGWWRDVVNEATFEGHHKPIVQLGHRYGMMLFIASEVMFFAAFFWAFFDASLFPREMPVDVPGNLFITALWAPVGLRYHATHHLFPSLPYHNLGKAHRRLHRDLSDRSHCLSTLRGGLCEALRHIWNEARSAYTSPR